MCLHYCYNVLLNARVCFCRKQHEQTSAHCSLPTGMPQFSVVPLQLILHLQRELHKAVSCAKNNAGVDRERSTLIKQAFLWQGKPWHCSLAFSGNWQVLAVYTVGHYMQSCTCCWKQTAKFCSTQLVQCTTYKNFRKFVSLFLNTFVFVTKSISSSLPKNRKKNPHYNFTFQKEAKYFM